MDRLGNKTAVVVAGRLSPAKFRTLQGWCSGTYRKRSEVVSIVLDRVLEILEQGGQRPTGRELRRALARRPAAVSCSFCFFVPDVQNINNIRNKRNSSNNRNVRNKQDVYNNRNILNIAIALASG